MQASFENAAYDWEMLIIQLFKTVNKTISCGYSGIVIDKIQSIENF